MQRRATGSVIVVVALMGALVVPNLGDRAIPGRPQAVEVPATPALGDCILSPVRAEDDLNWTQVVVRAADTRIGPCSGTRYGEIVAVVEAPLEVLAGGLDTVGQYCSTQAAAFQGVPDSVVDGRSPGEWSALLWTPALPLRPSALEQAAGRTWTACVAFPVPEADELAPYDATLADVFRTGTPAATSGTCRDVADLTVATFLPCSAPHAVEEFGWAFTDGIDPTGSATPQERADGCTQLISLLTRMPDPTAGGDLHVSVATAPEDSAVPADDPTNTTGTSDLWCRIVTLDGRTLTGTLLGLGEQPVPFT